MELNKRRAAALYSLCASVILDIGDFIEQTGIPLLILQQYWGGARDFIEPDHFSAIAIGIGMTEDELYDKLADIF